MAARRALEPDQVHPHVVLRCWRGRPAQPRSRSHSRIREDWSDYSRDRLSRNYRISTRSRCNGSRTRIASNSSCSTVTKGSSRLRGTRPLQSCRVTLITVELCSGADREALNRHRGKGIPTMMPSSMPPVGLGTASLPKQDACCHSAPIPGSNRSPHSGIGMTSRAHDIEQAVQQAAHVRRARPTSGLSRRNKRLEQPVLVVAQGLARAEVSDQCSICGRPHSGLQPGAPRTPSHGASCPSSGTDRPSCFRLDRDSVQETNVCLSNHSATTVKVTQHRRTRHGAA